METISDSANAGERYKPAMEITDQEKALEYFDALVQWHMRVWGVAREEAERAERGNLGYFAGYYSTETRRRVEELFRCAHPVFGGIRREGSPTKTQARRKGFEEGKKIVLDSRRA